MTKRIYWLKQINIERCNVCGKSAKYCIMDARNSSLGEFCRRCAKVRMKELKSERWRMD